MKILILTLILAALLFKWINLLLESSKNRYIEKVQYNLYVDVLNKREIDPIHLKSLNEEDIEKILNQVEVRFLIANAIVDFEYEIISGEILLVDYVQVDKE